MLEISLDKKDSSGLKVLCLGALCDDIEIGCGGTILRLLETHGNTEVYWIVFGSTPQRAREAARCAKAFLQEARKRKILIKTFRDGFFPYIGGRIKDFFETLKSTYSPDLILTHYRYDLHQDHRVISELTWNTFRDHLILEYEVPKYDGDLGSPNFFVPLEEEVCARKIRYILGAFESQRKKHWFSEDLFRGIMRLRGMESSSHTPFAEGFYCRKLVLSSGLAGTVSALTKGNRQRKIETPALV